MRRALSQLYSATTGAPWLSQLGAASSHSAIRSAGEASTSYGGAQEDAGPCLVHVRNMSGKGGKKGAAAKAAPPPPPPPPPAAPTNPALLSAGARLSRRWLTQPDPLAYLTPEQRTLAESLVPPAPQPAGAAAPDAADAAAAAPAAAAPAAGAPALSGLGQLGLPLDRRDVASLLQQSLSGAMGQQVAFQPVVFNSIFQSATAAASYVASACESGVAWGRVERFFLAAVEADTGVQGIRVQVKGRLSRKNDMAQTKTWEWGSIPLKSLSTRIDYGFSAANTRLGTLGVKVWIYHKQGSIKEVFFPRSGGSHYRAATPPGALPAIRLDDLYGAAAERTTRLALPHTFASVGWWARPAAAQPAENRVGTAPGEIFEPGFLPGAGDSLAWYLQRRREAGRKFKNVAARKRWLETTGRYLTKQRRLAAAATSTATGASAMGRRPFRPLGRFQLQAYASKWDFMCRRVSAAQRLGFDGHAGPAAGAEAGKAEGGRSGRVTADREAEGDA